MYRVDVTEAQFFVMLTYILSGTVGSTLWSYPVSKPLSNLATRFHIMLCVCTVLCLLHSEMCT